MLAYDGMFCFNPFLHVIFVVCHSSMCTIIENHGVAKPVSINGRPRSIILYPLENRH